MTSTRDDLGAPGDAGATVPEGTPQAVRIDLDISQGPATDGAALPANPWPAGGDPFPGRVRRVVLDLVAGGTSALVAVAFDEPRFDAAGGGGAAGALGIPVGRTDGPAGGGPGSPRVVCSCGGAPGCAHVRAALAWIDRRERRDGAGAVPGAVDFPNSPVPARGLVELDAPAPPPRIRPSFPPGPPSALPSSGTLVGPASRSISIVFDTKPGTAPASKSTAVPSAHAERGPPAADLALALEDLVTEVVRAGLPAAARAPSVDEAVRRIVAAAPAPLPATLSRFLGRLRETLDTADAEKTARLLDGASRLVDGLREGDARLVAAWVGPAGASALLPGRDAVAAAASVPGTLPAASFAVERLYDVQLLEVAREWLGTLDRAGLERRWLVELAGGAVYREERLRGAPPPSLGPCPRTLRVELAEVEPGPPPRRVRLLQYEVAVGAPGEALVALETHAITRGEPLAARLREALGVAPGTAELLALVRPLALEARRGADHALVLEDDTEVGLVDEPGGVVAALGQAAGEHAPRLVVGRLVAREGSVALAPLSAVIDGPAAGPGGASGTGGAAGTGGAVGQGGPAAHGGTPARAAGALRRLA